VGDAPATITNNKREILLTAALTASRAYTLPAASLYPPGGRVTFIDVLGTLTAVNSAVITRAGSDTINGGTTLTVTTPFTALTLVSDGTSTWTVDVAGIKRGGTGATTAQAAIDNLTAASGKTNGYVWTVNSNTGAFAAIPSQVPPPTKVSMPVVGCVGTTGTLLWDTNTSTAPTATCTNGATNTTLLRGTADFIDTGGVHGFQQSQPLG
jgi:hypothetical protein